MNYGTNKFGHTTENIAHIEEEVSRVDPNFAVVLVSLELVGENKLAELSV